MYQRIKIGCCSMAPGSLKIVLRAYVQEYYIFCNPFFNGTPAQMQNAAFENINQLNTIKSGPSILLLLLRLPWPWKDRHSIELLESAHLSLTCLPALPSLLIHERGLSEWVRTTCGICD